MSRIEMYYRAQLMMCKMWLEDNAKNEQDTLNMIQNIQLIHQSCKNDIEFQNKDNSLCQIPNNINSDQYYTNHEK